MMRKYCPECKEPIYFIKTTYFIEKYSLIADEEGNIELDEFVDTIEAKYEPRESGFTCDCENANNYYKYNEATDRVVRK